MFKSTEILRGIPIGIAPNILKTPIRVFIDVTRKCNLNCKHCYAQKPIEKELNTLEMKVLLDEIAASNVVEVIFTGGEPFMREDFFELLEYAKLIGLTTIILSNATTITKEDAEKLKKLNVMRVQTSLDGLKDTHDEFRGVNGSFEDTVRGIRYLTSFGMNVRVNCAQLSQNVAEIDELLELCANMGVVEFAWYQMLPSGRGRENLNLGATGEEIFLIEEHLKDLKEKYLEKMLFMYSSSGKVEVKCDIYTLETYPVMNPKCGAGRQFCAITPDGGVKPCVFWEDSFCEYNIKERSLEWIWNNTKLFKELRSSDIMCGACKAFPWCGGSCRLVAYLHGGIYSKHPACTNLGICIDENVSEVKL
jgi:radical SAM protein with 4Fe4S-binding SPASM domain